MTVVLHLYVCLCVYKSMERKLYLIKLTCILVILYILWILCHIMLFGVSLHESFNSSKDILTTYQNLPKSIFYLFVWVQAFGFV